MGIVKRQTIKTSIVTYIGVALGAFNTLWLYPTFLKAEEIGLITLLTNIALIIAPLAQMGVNGIIVRYYPYVKESEEKKGAFLYLILLIPFLGYLFSMMLLFLCKGLIIDNFSANSPLIIDYLIWLVPFTFIIVGRNVAENFARAQFRTAMPKFFKDVVLRFLTIAVILIYFFYNLPLDVLVIATIGAFGVNLIILLIYLKRLTSIKAIWSLKPLDKGMVRESLIYGIYFILTGFAGMIVTKIDSWMIATKLDLENTGIFTIALYIGLAIEMPKRSLNLISMPVIGKSMKEGRMDEVKTLYSKSSLIQLIVGSLLLICVWINIDELFLLIPNSEIYSQGKYVVLFIGLGVLFDMATGVNNEIILMSKYYRWNVFIISILIALTIINNEILIPLYGITGAAMATALSIFLFNIIKYIIVYVKLGIQPFSKKTILAILIALVVYLLGLILPSTSSPMLDILYKSSLLVSVYLALHHYLKTSEDLEKLINQVFGILKRVSKK